MFLGRKEQYRRALRDQVEPAALRERGGGAGQAPYPRGTTERRMPNAHVTGAPFLNQAHDLRRSRQKFIPHALRVLRLSYLLDFGSGIVPVHFYRRKYVYAALHRVATLKRCLQVMSPVEPEH